MMLGFDESMHQVGIRARILPLVGY